VNEYIQVLQKYAVFNGRASRKEYWLFFLINMLVAVGIGIVLGILKAVTHINLMWLGSIYSLGVLCPGLAVLVRRLHDTNRSGFWALLGLIPVIGSIVVLVFLCLPSVNEGNEFAGSRI
jgi:uncharacterized membrane protein YhaH (DUF805 family)